jgi:hypothetical protein
MRSVYQPCAGITQSCGHKKLAPSAEPPQEHCPQSIGALFHVKRVGLHAAVIVRKKPRIHSVLAIPSNVLISLSQRHSNIPQSIVDAARVVSYTQVQATAKTPAHGGLGPGKRPQA